VKIFTTSNQKITLGKNHERKQVFHQKAGGEIAESRCKLWIYTKLWYRIIFTMQPLILNILQFAHSIKGHFPTLIGRSGTRQRP
jgi:hypothetical protein